MAIGGKRTGPRPKAAAREHREHNAPGGATNPFGRQPDKAALVERLRAAAKKREAGPGKG
jgi:hypothetical protein